MATGIQQRVPGPRYKHVADEASPYETITIDKLTPIIGAEIAGVDLSKPLSNRTADEIHRALAENLVIFFRDQQLTQEQHLAFGRMFGDLHIHPAAPHAPGHPELMIIHADKDSPRANGEGWHSDVSCDEEPPMGSILHMHTVPPDGGGDTMFANMYAAFEALSQPIQRMLKGMTAIHDSAKAHGYRVKATDRSDKAYPRFEHPVVRTHPVTGRKALNVNRGFTSRIVQLKQPESEAMLDMLYNHIETPEFICRFRWQQDSVAFWDNRSTQHHALFDYFPHRRYGLRVTVAGDKPFYRA
jgi:taurine dioxygenase